MARLKLQLFCCELVVCFRRTAFHPLGHLHDTNAGFWLGERQAGWFLGPQHVHLQYKRDSQYRDVQTRSSTCAQTMTGYNSCRDLCRAPNPEKTWRTWWQGDSHSESCQTNIRPLRNCRPSEEIGWVNEFKWIWLLWQDTGTTFLTTCIHLHKTASWVMVLCNGGRKQDQQGTPWTSYAPSMGYHATQMVWAAYSLAQTGFGLYTV